jgi:hypothetical protein
MGLLFWVALVNGVVGLAAVGALLYLSRRKGKHRSRDRG